MGMATNWVSLGFRLTRFQTPKEADRRGRGVSRDTAELVRTLMPVPRARNPVPAPTPPAIGGGPGRRPLSL